MIDNYESKEDKIKFDLKWLKEALVGLTNEERCLILSEYMKYVGDEYVGMQEYQAFVKLFNDME